MVGQVSVLLSHHLRELGGTYRGWEMRLVSPMLLQNADLWPALAGQRQCSDTCLTHDLEQIAVVVSPER